MSEPRIGILTYFGRKSRVSIEKLMEGKLKLALHESQVPYEKEILNNVDKLGEDTKKGLAEIPNEKSKESSPRSESKVEDFQEAMQYPFFPFDGEGE